LAGLSTLAAAAAAENDHAGQQLLEKEWQLEAQLRSESPHADQLTTRDDAAGGCDGVTNGKWGFHTAEQDNPWWQVDLGEMLPLAQVRVWNRADSDEAAKRARHFRILISNDGQDWRQVYQHDGSIFYGYYMPDRSALAVKLTNAEGRFVRVQLPGKSILHLDEVEVTREGQSENIALHKPADQSSLSQWSAAHGRKDRPVDWSAEARQVLANCERMLNELRSGGEDQNHARPHPGPLPQERGNRSTGLGLADSSGRSHGLSPKKQKSGKNPEGVKSSATRRSVLPPREDVSKERDFTTDDENVEARSSGLPLLGGEGWGEGERSSQLNCSG